MKLSQTKKKNPFFLNNDLSQSGLTRQTNNLGHETWIKPYKEK
jgi:hypothetical protein